MQVFGFALNWRPLNFAENFCGGVASIKSCYTVCSSRCQQLDNCVAFQCDRDNDKCQLSSCAAVSEETTPGLTCYRYSDVVHAPTVLWQSESLQQLKCLYEVYILLCLILISVAYIPHKAKAPTSRNLSLMGFRPQSQLASGHRILG